jgi:NADH:ubiquinone oxidoreductase subunit 6 (subunit J)
MIFFSFIRIKNKEMLIFILSLLLVLNGLILIIIKNPIQNIFLLILIFLQVSGLILLLGIEFLALVLVVVYIGAIAVMFLFVIMMLNIMGGNVGFNYNNNVFICKKFCSSKNRKRFKRFPYFLIF